MKRAKRNYVNNPEFLQALIDYKKLCAEAENSGEPNPQIPRYIGECVYQIAKRLATKPNFSGYTYKDEMISDGLENAIQALGNFDPEKSSNPFAYFTQIIWYAFLRRIEKEKKQLYIRHKVTEGAVLSGTATTSDGVGESGETSYIDLNNDYMNDFVSAYERKMESKKTYLKKKKGLEKFVDDDDTNISTEDDK